MPAFGPIRRTELLRALHAVGFEGPFSGGKHQFMIRGQRTLRVPNPHQTDIGRGLLSRLLRQAGIERDEWERL